MTEEPRIVPALLAAQEQPSQYLQTRTTTAISRWCGRAVDILMPPRCLVCKHIVAGRDTLCGSCWSSVHFIGAPYCDRLGLPLPYATGEVTISAAALANPPAYDRARAAAHYSASMRTLIHQLKYSDRLEGRAMLVRWLIGAGRDLLPGADVVIPVPLSRGRLLWRHFNQSAFLGQELARQTGIGFSPMALVRHRATRPQVGLTEAQRRQNVAGAFAVRPARRAEVADRNVLLIDDVITTGATVEACTRVLRRAGARRVDVLALARVTNEVGVVV